MKQMKKLEARSEKRLDQMSKEHKVEQATLNRELRERFIPIYYARELQRLYQYSKSMVEYCKEIEMALIRAQILESPKALIARFFHGFDREIQDGVDSLLMLK
ncbi:hypothetical protein CR513_55720, partial [Mucuna pruriens]